MTVRQGFEHDVCVQVSVCPCGKLCQRIVTSRGDDITHRRDDPDPHQMPWFARKIVQFRHRGTRVDSRKRSLREHLSTYDELKLARV